MKQVQQVNYWQDWQPDKSDEATDSAWNKHKTTELLCFHLHEEKRAR